MIEIHGPGMIHVQCMLCGMRMVILEKEKRRHRMCGGCARSRKDEAGHLNFFHCHLFHMEDDVWMRKKKEVQ